MISKFRPVYKNLNTTTSIFQRQLRNIHILPKLDYPVADGVQPCFDGRQLDFHYNKHHSTYVNNLNNLVKGTNWENLPLDEIIIKTQGDAKNIALYNNSAQHFNHAFFWKSLKPNPNQENNEPSGKLADAIQRDFGSIPEFKKQFTESATKLFGSGWTFLVVDANKKLKIWNGGNAECPIGHKLIPILTVDVWEHAYYLVHQNRRPEYLKAYWSVVNWDFAAENFEKATN